MSKKKMRIIGEQKSPYVEDASGSLQYRPEAAPEKKTNHRATLNIGAVIIVVATCVGIFAAKSKPIAKTLVEYSAETKLPEGVTEEYITKMQMLGLGNAENIRTYSYILERQKWHKKYGLVFIGNEEMKKFLKDNDFVIGEARRYKDNIPVTEGNLINENLHRIKESLPHRQYPVIRDGITYIGGDNPSEPIMDIFIIASAMKFNTEGMVIEEGVLKAIAPPDPIAVVKVQNGYVELAHW